MRNRFFALIGLVALTAGAQAAPATKSYSDPKHRFSVEYPADWRPDKTALPNLGMGSSDLVIGFAVPDSLTKGSNLSRDSRVTIEALPNGPCSAARFLEEGSVLKTVKEKDVRYSVGTFSDAGAGNFYDQTIYVRDGSKPCLAIRLFIHSTNIGNYDPGTVHKFDRKKLVAAFDNIRRSLKVSR